MRRTTIISTKISLTVMLTLTSYFGSAQLCIPPLISTPPVSISVCQNQVSVFTVIAVGLNLNYQWQVNPGSGFINCSNGPTFSGATTASLSVQVLVSLNGSKYRCRVSNQCGSITSGQATLTVPGNVSATASPSSICPGGSSTLTASGAMSYRWSTGETTASITVSPSSTTTYTVTGTTLICTSTANVTVTVKPTPNVTISPSSPSVCIGGSVTLMASGASTYLWNTGATTASITVSPSTTTSYSVTGTGANGCTASKSKVVVVNPKPQVAINPASPSICSGSSVTLTATGASTYQWNTGATGSSLTVSPSTTTTYTLTGTDGNGCSATASATVTVKPSPGVTVSASSPSLCSGTSTTLTANGASTYLWSTGDTTGEITVSPNATTTYAVTGTAGDCSSTASITIPVFESPEVTITVSSSQICPGGSATLTASGAEIFYWNTGESSASITVSPTETTTYTVAGTSHSYCTDMASVTVGVNPNPDVTVSASPTEICSGGSTTLTAAGASNYLWSTGETTESIVVSPPTTTTYTVTATTNGCSVEASVTVTVFESPVVTITASPEQICTGNSSTLTATGAEIYFWSTGESSPSISVNPTETTTYWVAGTTHSFCTSVTTVTVNVIECAGSGGRTRSDPTKVGSSPWDESKPGLDRVTVYPNPATGVFYVVNAPKEATVEVFNLLGQKVFHGSIDEEGATEVNLNTGSMEKAVANGLYVLVIKDHNSIIHQSKRVVKRVE